MFPVCASLWTAEMATADQWPLRRGSLIYPSPVAIACGRILRVRSAVERVDACLKAAEVLTRYLAAVAVASFASRDDESEANLSELSGNLSFGHFLTTVQEVTAARGQHPARLPLRYAFRASKKEKGSGATNEALAKLLTLRNRLGHELATLDETRAGIVEADDRPLDALVQALTGAEALLALPLFVVEQQDWVKKDDTFVLRRLLLMESRLTRRQRSSSSGANRASRVCIHHTLRSENPASSCHRGFFGESTARKRTSRCCCWIAWKATSLCTAPSMAASRAWPEDTRMRSVRFFLASLGHLSQYYSSTVGISLRSGWIFENESRKVVAAKMAWSTGTSSTPPQCSGTQGSWIAMHQTRTR
jgi:hypothetical protein